MTYPTLTPEVFGRRLIESGDLDPVYIALASVDWDEAQKKRWLVAYWLFYHPGFASYAAQQQSSLTFWGVLKKAAANVEPSPLGQRWPRASERRHFRGDKASAAVEQLRKDFPRPDILVDFVAKGAPDYAKVAAAVKSLPQMGDWIAFKVADMLDRCLGVKVIFDLAAVTMFDDPKKAALMVARRRLGMAEAARFKDEPAVIRSVVEHLIAEFKDLDAPPANDRQIDYQEVETVLCKYKSHVNGHYPVGKDCREIREGLSEWAEVSDAAREFLHYMPAGETTGEAIPA